MRCLLVLATVANITVQTQWPNNSYVISGEPQVYHSLVMFLNVTNFSQMESICSKIRVRLYKNQNHFVSTSHWRFVYATGICQCSFLIDKPDVYTVVYTYRNKHV